LFRQRIANEDDFLEIVTEQMTRPIPFAGKIAPDIRTYDPEKNKVSDTWVPARSPHHVVSLTMETAWNAPGSTQSGYLKTGEHQSLSGTKNSVGPGKSRQRAGAILALQL